MIRSVCAAHTSERSKCDCSRQDGVLVMTTLSEGQLLWTLLRAPSSLLYREQKSYGALSGPAARIAEGTITRR